MTTQTKKHVLKILKIIDQNWNEKVLENEILDSKNSEIVRGRKQIYSDVMLFKIFIIMNLTNITSIKGIWRFIINNKDIKKACGIINDIDRSTLSRRLSDKIKPWF
ncbi:transposase [Candidatus Parcubacteria bacterium]|nr:transposase [Candidatus Parcubacteria bacterium]